jgi:uncharacterized membrane protein YgdD (TMEM256/DUF423 family)
MERKMVSVAAIIGMFAIVLGAFGAHALKKVLSIEQLNIFETGVKYQMYHALFLLVVGLSSQVTEIAKKRIFYTTVTGIFFFSGSIYLLATNDLTAFDFKVIGFITPIGGLFLIAGWACLFIDFLKKKS